MTCATFLLQNVVGLNAMQFGSLAFWYAACLALGAYTNAALVTSYGIWQMLIRGILLLITASVIMLAVACMQILNLWSILIPMSIFLFGAGLIFTNAFAGASKPYAHIAGGIGALYGCLQILSAALSSALMASLQLTSQLPLAVILVVLSLCALLAACVVR
jgi:DHA1 family 2-module integral membrane pump EmrD-like MFS transporter